METAWIADATRILQAIGWTLIHSLWQAAVIYGLLSLLLRSFPGLPARARYACGLAALGAVTLWSAVTLCSQWPDAAPASGGGSLARAGEGSTAITLYAWLDDAMPWLMMAYGLGLGLMLGRMLLGLDEIRRLRKSGTGLDGPFAAQLRALAGRLGISRRIALRESPLVAVPMVIGLLRPVILLPHSCIESLSPAALEAVLLHELAHIRRADYLANILQTVVESILFFNPCVRGLSALLRREREHCCDDLVVSHSGHPFEYAAALASLAAGGRQPAFALGAADGRYPLLNRIKRITSMEKKPSRPATLIVLAGISTLVIGISIACFTPALAQRKSKSAGATTHPAPPQPGIAAPPAAPAPFPVAAPAPPAPPAPPVPPAAAGDEDPGEAFALVGDVFRQLPGIIDSAFRVSGAALKDVNWDEMRRELRQARLDIDKVDWKAIEKETRTAFAQARRDIDFDAIGKEVQQALNTVDWDAVAQAGRTAAPRNAMDRAEYDRRMAQHDRDMAQHDRDMAEHDRQLAQHLQELKRSRGERAEAMSRARTEAGAQRASAGKQLEAARADMEKARLKMEAAREELDRAREAMDDARESAR